MHRLGGPATMTPVDLATSPPAPGTPIPFGARTDPRAIAITPDGRTAYVADWASGTIIPVDLTGRRPALGAPLRVGPVPDAIAITPDGRTGYVTSQLARTVIPVDLAARRPRPGTAIPVGLMPLTVAITPDGTAAYVAGDNHFGGAQAMMTRIGLASPRASHPAVSLGPGSPTSIAIG